MDIDRMGSSWPTSTSARQGIGVHEMLRRSCFARSRTVPRSRGARATTAAVMIQLRCVTGTLRPKGRMASSA